MALKQLKILGVNVTIASRRQVLNFLVTNLKKNSPIFVSTPNPEIVVAAQKDRELMDALNAASVALPDGAGLVWAMRILKKKNVERIPGREIFIELLSIANTKKLKVYFFGSTEAVNSLVLKKVKNEYANIKAQGKSGPLLYNNLEFVNDSDSKSYRVIISDINKFKPDILFVAFGAPKQEKWIYENLKVLNVKIAMAVGGSFDTFSGKVVLPPEWMARSGLEWLWRVLLEPKRIFRIINATVVFPLLILREKFFGSRSVPG